MQSIPTICSFPILSTRPIFNVGVKGRPAKGLGSRGQPAAGLGNGTTLCHGAQWGNVETESQGEESQDLGSSPRPSVYHCVTLGGSLEL